MTERENNDINQAQNSKTGRNVLWTGEREAILAFHISNSRINLDIGILIRTSSSLNSKKDK